MSSERGHVGFSAGYSAIALASEDGARQVVVMTNGQPVTQDVWDASWDAIGRLIWDAYCG